MTHGECFQTDVVYELHTLYILFNLGILCCNLTYKASHVTAMDR